MKPVRQYDPNLNRVHAMDEKGERPSKKFKETTMNGQDYANLLAQARGSRTKRRSYRASAVLQDNASVHSAGFEAGPEGHGFPEIDHPLYSSDLAQCIIFSNLKGVTWS
ncbi:hypothetical protein EVAR_39645_1 [Eumeta japonica]|uniref:Uncharacterized protein n=1 Tax=Eumeta variegata TaxID=151549 RepID=A0A4C1WIU4_EUMVA|nr:hypothetical protein EVAR_39645_1 [Eumeta japonica]